MLHASPSLFKTENFFRKVTPLYFFEIAGKTQSNRGIAKEQAKQQRYLWLEKGGRYLSNAGRLKTLFFYDVYDLYFMLFYGSTLQLLPLLWQTIEKLTVFFHFVSFNHIVMSRPSHQASNLSTEDRWKNESKQSINKQNIHNKQHPDCITITIHI